MVKFEEKKGINIQLADRNGIHYPGLLDLTNDGILLEVYAESNQQRHFQLDYQSLSTLRCDSFNQVFFLYGVQMESHYSSALNGDNSERGFLRIQFSANKAVVVYGHAYTDSKVQTIEFSSGAIEDWIGTTTTQIKIPTLSIEEITANSGKALKEFEVELPNIGKLSLKYKWARGGIDKFHVGTSFPPCLVLKLSKELTFEDSMKTIDDLKQLLYFLIGTSFDLDINLNLGMHQEGYIFESNKPSNYSNSHSVLYPLLHNAISDYTYLPPFNIDSIAKYFSLSEGVRYHWFKYLSYKKMENPEEKYLGYFRVLESLLHKQENFLPPEKFDSCIESFKEELALHFDVKPKKMTDFLRYIKTQVNSKKYNAERNLTKQFKGLPKEYKDTIKFNQSDLNSIVQLRNAITHASHYSLSQRDMLEKLTFLESLLIFEMFRAIGIEYDSSVYAVFRMARFSYIKNHSAILN
ncbi:hypothetical protein BCT39_16725 [Vibrio lentus]|uniref:ApeA N-terminal domain 1-containing protein n=1 Tax=Vibrio lentus TaxID=136468 RepID=UPI000C81F958|nr:HEPN domain-containing protein [Vibrio lentus]PMN17010.1 hypothetical protein BCT39_16725 [Vibrio lentus]